MKKEAEIFAKISRRNSTTNTLIGISIAFLLTYTLYARINLNFQGGRDFIYLFLVTYFFVAFIPLYRLVDLTAFKNNIGIFKKYGVPETILLHYEELKIKSGWYLLHLFLAMTFFVLVFAIT